jgi:2-isopropylmalate synthase
VLCLCDTNGGTITFRLVDAVAEVRKRFDGVIGIHTHNDSDLAVANSIAAVEAGATHVQGCMNGYGERCGNANLASVLTNLELKLGHTTVGPEKLAGLTSVCRFIAELANLPLPNDRPFVGKSAFAHKGGVHVAAVLKDSATYEHIRPEAVGNRQRVLVSDLSGRGNILYKLKQHGLADRLDEDSRRELLERIKQMEYEGYELEAAEGTFELLVREALNPGLHFFEVDSYEVSTRAGGPATQAQTSATVTLQAQDGVHTATARGTDRSTPAPVPAEVPGEGVPADRQRAADRLQSARARFAQRHRRARARADRMVGPPPKLGHGGRFRQRDRGQLEGAGGRYPAGIDAAHREGHFHREGRRGLLLGRVNGHPIPLK